MDKSERTTEDCSEVGSRRTRLDVLNKSLERKNELIEKKISEHFLSVKAANGQPLNDKVGGTKTLDRWERQNDAIRNLSQSIDKTKSAIEREQAAIDRVESVAGDLPDAIKRGIESGLLRQWRKHPKTFFVSGVDKARIVLRDDGKLAHRYASQVTDPEQRKILARTFNYLSDQINNSKGKR